MKTVNDWTWCRWPFFLPIFNCFYAISSVLSRFKWILSSWNFRICIICSSYFVSYFRKVIHLIQLCQKIHPIIRMSQIPLPKADFLDSQFLMHQCWTLANNLQKLILNCSNSSVVYYPMQRGLLFGGYWLKARHFSITVFVKYVHSILFKMSSVSTLYFLRCNWLSVHFICSLQNYELVPPSKPNVLIAFYCSLSLSLSLNIYIYISIKDV